MNSRILFWCLSCLSFLLVWWSRDFIFFWDTVQFAGKHALWFYDNGLLGLLPEQLDSGHPPFFGMYLAIVWKVFGKSLVVSSFAMLPFLIANIFYAIKLGELLLKERYWLFPISLFCCAYYLGHSILVSPDLVLVTGFLMCLYGIVAYKRAPIVVGSIILSLVSMRGFAMMIGLILFHCVQLYGIGEKGLRPIKKSVSLFVPALMVFVIYQIYHYVQSSWIGFHDSSPWSASFASVGFVQLGKNMVVFIWRLFDYGMVLPYLILAYFIFKNKELHSLIYLLFILMVILAVLVLPFIGLLNHRYFLPIQLVALLLTFYCLRDSKLIYSMLLLVGIFLGNLMIYPDHIAQGWDSTAAHWPFYKMEKEMHDFIINDARIDAKEIGTAFPLRVTRKFLNPNSAESGYRQYDISKDSYILYSNVMNEFSDIELDQLEKWTVLKELRSRGVYMKLVKSNSVNR